MKNSLACPKCDSRKLWRIEQLKTTGRGQASHTLRVIRGRDKPGGAMGFFDVSQQPDCGHFDAYICAMCGYSEFWADDFAEIQANPEDGVHFIDTTPQQGEYR